MQQRILFPPPEIIADIEKYNIFFIKAIPTLVFRNLPPDTVVVYHNKAQLPKIEGSANVMDFQVFKTKYLDIHANLYIIIGLNRLITPQDRCDTVSGFLLGLTKNIPKISVDVAPFIGEPWRLFFHYLMTNNNKFEAEYSYALETEWKYWFSREESSCQLSPENLPSYITKTFSNLSLLRTSFNFREITKSDEEWYLEAKKHVFEQYDSLKNIINGLLRLANTRFNLKMGFDSYLLNQGMELPNIGVYRFIAEENIRRRDIYNAIIEASGK